MITFKPLEKSDFRLLFKWLTIDFVTKWYEKRKFTYDDVERKYSKYVDGSVPTESFIIEYDKTPIGYIQTYRIDDYPEYSECVRLAEHTAGLDIFIGERDFIHKGLGKDIITKFLKEIVFSKKDIEQCIVGPEPGNRSAIHAYEKAGFIYVKTVLCKHSNENEYIMLIKRFPSRDVYHRL